MTLLNANKCNPPNKKLKDSMTINIRQLLSHEAHETTVSLTRISVCPFIGNISSRVHATLQPALSVGQLVG